RFLFFSLRVCKRWKTLILDKSLWRCVDLTPFKLNSKIFWHLVRHWFGSSLQTLKVKGLLNSVNNQEFLTPAVLQVFEKRFPNLEHLHLQETNLRFLSYDCLPSTLKTLELSECEIPLAWFTPSTTNTKALPKLDTLIVNRVPSFSSRHLKSICSQCDLKTLRLFGTYRVNDTGFQNAVPHLKGLEHFKLEWCKITNITLHLIGCHLKRLRTLAIIEVNNLTDEGLACLSGLKALERLWLEGCFSFSPTCIVSVCAGLPVLNYLHLDGAYYRDQIEDIQKGLPHCTVSST
ncbi:hypothetical protein GDO81_021161, partial [Engystomops pustulosus]